MEPRPQLSGREGIRGGGTKKLEEKTDGHNQLLLQQREDAEGGASGSIPRNEEKKVSRSSPREGPQTRRYCGGDYEGDYEVDT